jgi:Trypsin-like peptidase domain
MTTTKRTLLFLAGAISLLSTLCLAIGVSKLPLPKVRIFSLSLFAGFHVTPTHRAALASPPPSGRGANPSGASIQRLASLPPLSDDLLELLKHQPPTQTKGRLQIGVGRSFEPIVVNASTAPAAQWTPMANGGRSWSIQVSSPGALGLRVHLEGVRLPGATQIIFYDPAHPDDAAPPITAQTLDGQTDIWTAMVFSDTTIIQVQAPPNTDLASVSFTASSLSHIYTLPGANPTLTKGIAGTCEVDVSCYPAYAQAASGVALMDYVDGGNTYTCTGCLLASTDPNAVNDYFLTAHHCVGTQTLASTIELFWFYQTPSCDGTPPTITSLPTTSGSTLLATSAANDFTFLRLAAVAPSGATPLSWTVNPPNTNGTLTIIHHPAGDYKRISFGNFFGSDADFWAVQWTNGVTEGGSSGGPLLNSSMQVVGQLNGGFDGPGSSCSDPTAPDQFGRFDLTYPAIQQWIDPSGTSTNTGGGDTNDVTPVQGTYYGLFFDGGNGVSQQSSGSFILTSTATGKFSGRVQIGSSVHTFTGRFNSTGASDIIINRRGSTQLTVQFQLNPNDTDQISGVVSDGTFEAQLNGERAVFTKSNPASMAGRYTMAIQGSSGSTTEPAGTGYATVNVSALGKITASGALADGTRFTESTTLSQSGQWPFYVSLYNGQGSLFSSITFTSGDDTSSDSTNSVGTNITSGNINGALSWIKPAMSNAKAYPGGFVLDTTVTGSTFTKSTPVLSLSGATLTLATADSSINISDTITLNPNNRITNLSSNRVSMSFSGATGTFTGSVQNPGSSTLVINGVVLQDQGTAVGYFLYQGQSGQVTVGP